jgi:Ras family protein T1
MLVSTYPEFAQSETPLVRDRGLTETGFIQLQMYFIQRARLETTWTVLRKFGYGDDLMLKDDFLNPRSARTLEIYLTIIDDALERRFDVPGDCSVELSPRGYQFLTELFETFDKVTDVF